MLFGERSAILVDPGEEKLKSEFAGVKRSYIPMQSIIRIDEVEKQGAAKISEGGDSGKIATFPIAPPAPRALLQTSNNPISARAAVPSESRGVALGVLQSFYLDPRDPGN